MPFTERDFKQMILKDVNAKKKKYNIQNAYKFNRNFV